MQGHEERAEQHIFGRYFLQGCQEQTTIYPFIHDFNNYLEDSDPNRPLTLPFALQTSYVFYPLTLGQFVLLYRSHH